MKIPLPVFIGLLMDFTSGLPQRNVEVCTDRNIHCNTWARTGECIKSLEYMSNNCKKSCDHCDWTPGVNACIRGNNNRIVDQVSTFVDCKYECQLKLGTSCNSVEYHTNSRRCVLSDANSDSHLQSYSEPCHDSGWTYSEVKDWTPGVNACIRGNNNRIVDQVSTFVDCKYECKLESGFRCSSVEYHINSGRCVLSDANSFSHFQSYTQPCHDSGWTYSEVKGHQTYGVPPAAPIGPPPMAAYGPVACSHCLHDSAWNSDDQRTVHNFAIPAAAPQSDEPVNSPW